MEYDPLDYLAQRANASRFLEHVKDIIDSGLQYQGLTDEDRRLLEIAKRNLYSFGQLDESFIAPRAEQSRATATHGYEMLWLLMSASFCAGSCGTLTDSAKTFIAKELHRSRQVERGKRSGASRRANRKWTAHASALALEIRKEDSSARPSTIASEILGRWKLQEIDPPEHDTLSGKYALDKQGGQTA